MGGMSGQIRGKSKIEVYLKYVEEAERCAGVFEDVYPPKNKRACKSLMVQDQETGEWILRYRWHT